MLQNGKQHKGEDWLELSYGRLEWLLEHGGQTRSCVKPNPTLALGVKATEEESEEESERKQEAAQTVLVREREHYGEDRSSVYAAGRHQRAGGCLPEDRAPHGPFPPRSRENGLSCSHPPQIPAVGPPVPVPPRSNLPGACALLPSAWTGSSLVCRKPGPSSDPSDEGRPTSS